MWGQYIILNRHGVINKSSMWILHVKPKMLQGVQLDCCCNQTTALFEIGQIIRDGGGTDIAYLKWLFVVEAFDNKVSGYSWCQICTDSIQNDLWISEFLFKVIVSVKDGTYCFHFSLSTFLQMTVICVFSIVYTLCCLCGHHWSHWMNMGSMMTFYIIVGDNLTSLITKICGVSPDRIYHIPSKLS